MASKAVKATKRQATKGVKKATKKKGVKPRRGAGPPLRVEWRPLATVKPYGRNPRTHEAGIEQIAASIERYGFRQPIVVDAKGVIVAGHGRYLAAKQLGLTKVPVHVARDLTAKQIRGLRIADNATAGHSTWDLERLDDELADLLEDAEIELGFVEGEIDELLAAAEAETAAGKKHVEFDASETEPQLGEYEYRIVVECKSEAHQRRVLKKLEAEGLKCRALIS